MPVRNRLRQATIPVGGRGLPRDPGPDAGRTPMDRPGPDRRAGLGGNRHAQGAGHPGHLRPAGTSRSGVAVWRHVSWTHHSMTALMSPSTLTCPRPAGATTSGRAGLTP